MPAWIVIPGGSGQVGAVLARAFPQDDVVVIGRGGPVVWDGRTLGPWAEAIYLSIFALVLGGIAAAIRVGWQPDGAVLHEADLLPDLVVKLPPEPAHVVEREREHRRARRL